MNLSRIYRTGQLGNSRLIAIFLGLGIGAPVIIALLAFRIEAIATIVIAAASALMVAHAILSISSLRKDKSMLVLAGVNIAILALAVLAIGV